MISKKSYTAPFAIWVIADTVIPILTIAYYGITNRNGAFTLENITAVSYTHLDVYKRQILLYGEVRLSRVQSLSFGQM